MILSFDGNDDYLSAIKRLSNAVDGCSWIADYGCIKSGSFSSEGHVDILRCSVESSDGLKRCFDVRVWGVQTVRAVFSADCSEEIDMVESLIEALVALEKRKYSEF